MDPDFAIFTVFTPFLGTEIYETVKQKGWIEDSNWSNYDMAHAIILTEMLSRREVQEELCECYRSFYGSLQRRVSGIFSNNELKRRIYRHMAGQDVVRQFRTLF